MMSGGGGRAGCGALRELTSLLAENADPPTDKVALLASLCPSLGVFKENSGAKITARHLNGFLAIAQFLAQSNGGQHRQELLGVVLEFLRSVPRLARSVFWPSCFSSEAAKSYFPELLSHIARISAVDSGASLDVSSAIADLIQRVSAGGLGSVEGILASSPGAKMLFFALGDNCPSLHLQDREKVVLCLLEHWIQAPQLGNGATLSSEMSYSVSPVRRNQQATPLPNGSRSSLKDLAVAGTVESGKLENSNSPFVSPYSTASSSPDISPFSTPLKRSGEQTPVRRPGLVSGTINEGRIYEQVHVSSSQGAYDGTLGLKLYQLRLETESLSSLDRQDIGFRLLACILEKADNGSTLRSLHVQQLKTEGVKQLRTLIPILKVRKRDWPKNVNEFKTKIGKMLQVSQAAAVLQIKCIRWLKSDEKLSKIALRESLPLLMDAADACNSSPWRRSKACEVLFDSLITGVAQVAALHRSRLQRTLLRFKTLVLTACAQANTWGSTQGPAFESIIKGICILIEAGWNSDKGAVKSFLLTLAAHVREKDKGDKANLQVFAMVQLNVVSFLADLSISLDKSEVVELILPILIESLEEGDASSPSLVRLKLLEAVGRLACLGSEKSYREVVVLLTRSYLDKLSMVGSTHSRTVPPEGTIERLETLPGALLHIARGLRQATLRVDYRHRLLALCSDVGLVAEAKNGRVGADSLGPLLPAVAEVCVDVNFAKEVETSSLKLYRNLWFYIALFGLAPPLSRWQSSTSKSGNQGGIFSHISSGLSQAINAGLNSGVSSGLSTGSLPLQAIAGPYSWNPLWATAVEQISEGTPPLVVGSVKWLEDELELNALYNPGSQRGCSNEKAMAAQRAALSAALGGCVEVSSMSSISGVTATYLLAVTFLEALRFKRSGGVVRSSLGNGSTSALSFVFKYLETPSLSPSIHQCLMAIVHQAFSAAMLWLAAKSTATGEEAGQRDAVIIAHASFLIRTGAHRQYYIRELADNLLTQLKNTFPQVLWNPNCLHDMLSLVSDVSPPTQATDSGWLSARSLSHHKVREWISQALLMVPCTMQGVIQELLRGLNRWQSTTNDLLSVLSGIRVEALLANDTFSMGCIPAVAAAAAAAAGLDPKLAKTGSMEVLSTGIISANIKSNYSGEIGGMQRLYAGMGGLSMNSSTYTPNGFGARRRMSFNDADEREGQGRNVDRPRDQDLKLYQMLTVKFVQQLQQYVVAAERRSTIDPAAFREACLRSAALLLSDLGTSEHIQEAPSHLLRLLCWCPAHIFTPEALETGLFVWTWILSAAPQLGSRVLAELVDAWLWTVDAKMGIFASGVTYSGPKGKLRPKLTPGEPEPPPNPDPVIGIGAHRVWLGFFLDRYEAIRHGSSDQLLLISRFLQGSICRPSRFSSHPAAAGTFFTLMLFGLKFSTLQTQLVPFFAKGGEHLLEGCVYRAGLSWFAVEPSWYDGNVEGIAQAEAISVSRFLQHLVSDQTECAPKEVTKRSQESGSTPLKINPQVDTSTFLKVAHDSVGRDQRKQLLVMLCQSEADRLETWANPLKDTLPRWRVGSNQWPEYVKTAWSVDPRIALALVSRFPGVNILRAEVSSLVQRHVAELYEIPEALPYIVTPKAVEEDSSVLQKLPYWAPCSITSALNFLTPSFKGHHRVLAYVLRVLETYPPETVTFFMPQLVQSLRYDHAGIVEGYLMVAAQQSSLFAHILIWQLQGEEPPSSEEKEAEKESSPHTENNLYDIVPRVKQHIIDSFTHEAHDVFVREFRFFDKITSISAALYPLPKDERRAGIRRELEKIEVEGDDLYLPTAPNKLVRGIKLDSGIPLQSAAKVPIMITFEVVDKDGDLNEIQAQACIFKVGDDCRQDLLALQVMGLLRDSFEAVGLSLYLFPYGVLPTGYGRGIIEVVPDTRSRNQMGEITDGGLYEIFQQDYGPVGSPRFEKARDNFIVSSAGYAVASLLLQPKDRHNGNLLFDSEGRLVHIDFGFILETSPGGNLRFESAQFKLSHEMTQLLDPSGSMKSEQWQRFVSLCVKGYLVAREHMEGIVSTVLLMIDSGLPCFSRGDPIGNLRKRFHPEMTEREAANFMIKTCNDAYNKWSTAGYDLIQYLQQGIEM